MRRAFLALVLGGMSLIMDWNSLAPGADAPVVGVVESVKLPPPLEGADHDWPQWRGPNRDGISPDTGLLKKWPENGPPVLFKLTDVGKGLASPAVVGDRLYILGKRGKNTYLLAFDMKSQKELWATPFGEGFPERTPHGEGDRATPTVDGDRVYVLSAMGDLACIDTSGTLLWKKNLPQDFQSKLQLPEFGYSESPLVDGDKVICCPGVAKNVMVALNKMTGEVIWKTELPDVGKNGQSEASYASCMVTEAGGVRQYVNLVGRGLIGVAARDGKFLWSYNRIANSQVNVPSPIIHGDHVFCSNGYRAGTCYLKLSADGQGGVKCDEEWVLKSEICENHCGGSVIIGDYAYLGHGQNAGIPLCVDLATGKVVWRAARQIGKGVASLIAADGMLIFRNESRELLLVEATPKGYNLVSVFKPESQERHPGWAQSVVAHGCLFVRSQSSLTVYDLRQR